MLEILFCLVVGISEGDTLTARCGEPGAYEQIKVRIVAIDAPENKQAFGNKSKQHLSDLCFQKQATIVVHYDDRYKHKVADVKCDGKDVSSEQVRAGMAWVYPQYAKKHEHGVSSIIYKNSVDLGWYQQIILQRQMVEYVSRVRKFAS